MSAVDATPLVRPTFSAILARVLVPAVVASRRHIDGVVELFLRMIGPQSDFGSNHS